MKVAQIDTITVKSFIDHLDLMILIESTPKEKLKEFLKDAA